MSVSERSSASPSLVSAVTGRCETARWDGVLLRVSALYLLVDRAS